MPDRPGFIYRRAGVSSAELRALLGADSRGWSWTPAFMYTRGARRDDDLLRGAEGCAYRPGVEIRWRPAARAATDASDSAPDDAGYDVLVLMLVDQPPDGFQPLLANGAAWRVEPTVVHVQHALGGAPGSDADEPRAATSFIAPDGAIQFVALIDSAYAAASNMPS